LALVFLKRIFSKRPRVGLNWFFALHKGGVRAIPGAGCGLGSLIGLAVMEQATPSPEILQFRAVLCETSPHVWRRLLVRSDCTLITFHKIVQCAFGWSARRAFVADIKGHRSKAAAVSNPALITLADLCLYDKERFGYPSLSARFGTLIRLPRPCRPPKRNDIELFSGSNCLTRCAASHHESVRVPLTP
jgi:hypothetical protein